MFVTGRLAEVLRTFGPASRRQELLPVPYFRHVFNLPHVLNELIGRHGP